MADKLIDCVMCGKPGHGTMVKLEHQKTKEVGYAHELCLLRQQVQQLTAQNAALAFQKATAEHVLAGVMAALPGHSVRVTNAHLKHAAEVNDDVQVKASPAGLEVQLRLVATKPGLIVPG